jgi:hypothetical protein
MKAPEALLFLNQNTLDFSPGMNGFLAKKDGYPGREDGEEVIFRA